MVFTRQIGISSNEAKTSLRLAPSPRDIYEKEFNPVWTFLYRLGIRGNDLDDLTQEVFIRFVERLTSFDARRALRPWLFGIAFRVASDHRRLVRHDREILASPEAVGDAVPLADQALIAHQNRQLVHRALLDLPLKRRAVFILHELNGESVRDIGAAMSLPLQTIYSRLRLAREEFAAAVVRLQRLSHGR